MADDFDSDEYAATAHAAQAIHLSQKTFGIDPAGTGDSLLFTR